MIVKANRHVYGCGSNENYQLGVVNQKNESGIWRLNRLMNEQIVDISCGSTHVIAKTVKRDWFGWGFAGCPVFLNKLVGKFCYSQNIKIPTKLKILNAIKNDIVNVFCGYQRTIIILK